MAEPPGVEMGTCEGVERGSAVEQEGSRRGAGGQVMEKASLAAPARTHCPTVLPLCPGVEGVQNVACSVTLEIN